MKSWRSRSKTARWAGGLALVVIVALVIVASYRHFGSPGGALGGLAGGEPQRDRESLRQAIASTRQQCSSINASFFQGTMEQSEYWSVRCADGQEYEVRIDPQGARHVQDCDVLARLATRPCFTVLPRR